MPWLQIANGCVVYLTSLYEIWSEKKYWKDNTDNDKIDYEEDGDDYEVYKELNKHCC